MACKESQITNSYTNEIKRIEMIPPPAKAGNHKCTCKLQKVLHGHCRTGEGQAPPHTNTHDQDETWSFTAYYKVFLQASGRCECPKLASVKSNEAAGGNESYSPELDQLPSLHIGNRWSSDWERNTFRRPADAASPPCQYPCRSFQTLSTAGQRSHFPGQWRHLKYTRSKSAFFSIIVIIGQKYTNRLNKACIKSSVILLDKYHNTKYPWTASRLKRRIKSRRIAERVQLEFERRITAKSRMRLGSTF